MLLVYRSVSRLEITECCNLSLTKGKNREALKKCLKNEANGNCLLRNNDRVFSG